MFKNPLRPRARAALAVVTLLALTSPIAVAAQSSSDLLSMIARLAELQRELSGLISLYVSSASQAAQAGGPGPGVSIVASDSQVHEDFGSARFTVTRTGTATQERQINFTLAGSAQRGEARDYTASGLGGGVITFPAGVSSVDVTIDGNPDDVYEGNETIEITLEAGTNYHYVEPRSATITLIDDDPAPDTEGPTVTFDDTVTPADGSTVKGTVRIKANASDNSGTVTKVNIRVDGTVANSDTTGPAYTYNWDTTQGTTNGQQYLVRVVAYDAAGNTTSISRRLTVDNSAPADTELPAINFRSPTPAEGATIAGSARFEVDASDNSGTVSKVNFRLVTGGESELARSDTTPGSFFFNWDTSGYADGDYKVHATAWDPSGNTKRVTRTVKVANATPPTRDATPPSVSIAAPTGGATVSGTAVRLRAIATDNVGVTSVRFRIDGTNIDRDTGTPFIMDWDSTTLANGQYRLRAIARDAAGNLADTSILITVNNTTSTASCTFNGQTVPHQTAVTAWQKDGDICLSQQRTCTNGVLSGTYALASCTAAPSCTLTASPTSVKSGGAVTLSWKANNALSGTIGGVGAMSPIAAGSKIVYPTVTTTYKANVTGADGVTAGCDATVTMRTDSDPDAPVVSFDTPPTPAAASSVAGTVRIKALAHDTVGVTRVRIIIDGTTVNTDVAAPYIYDWDTTKVSNKEYAIRVEASDAAGNVGIARRHLTVANSAYASCTFNGQTIPHNTPVTAYQMSGNTCLSEQRTCINGTLTGSYMLAKCPSTGALSCTLVADPTSVVRGNPTTLRWTGSANATRITINRGVGEFDHAAGGSVQVWPTEAATTYTATVYDASNNAARCEATVAVTGSAEETLQTGDYVRPRERVSVRESASVNATRVGVQDTTARGYIEGASQSADGYIWWYVNWGNGADGWSVQDYLRKVQGDPDTTAPLVEFLSPAVGANVSNNVTLSVSASDPGGRVLHVQFSDGTRVIGTDTEAPYTATWNTWTGANGAATITATARDASGNATDVTRTFTVANGEASTEFTVGERVVAGDNIHVRGTAGGASLGKQLEGARGTVLGGPSHFGQHVWWNINWDTGVDGWSAEQFLLHDADAPTAPRISVTSPTAGARYTDVVPIAWESANAPENGRVYLGYRRLSNTTPVGIPSPALGASGSHSWTGWSQSVSAGDDYVVIASIFMGNTEVARAESPVFSLGAAAGPKFTAGDTVETTDRLRVRESPERNAPSRGVQPLGAVGTVEDGPRTAGGLVWWQIDWAEGPDGWSAQDYMRKVE